MSAEDQNLILKILSGAYSGSELSLTKPVYTLGTAYDCDVAIEDPSLLPQHLRVNIADGKIIIQKFSEGGPDIKLNDRVQHEPAFEMRLYDRVQVGDFIFGVGPAGVAWPSYEQVLERDRQEEQARQAAEEQRQAEEAAAEAAAQQAENAGAEGAPAAEEEASQAATDDAQTAQESDSGAQNSAGDTPSDGAEANNGQNQEDEGVAEVMEAIDKGEEKEHGFSDIFDIIKDPKQLQQKVSQNKKKSLAIAAAITLIPAIAWFSADDMQGENSMMMAEVVNPLSPSIQIGNAVPGPLSATLSNNGSQPINENVTRSNGNDWAGSSNINTSQGDTVWKPTEDELRELRKAQKSMLSLFDAFKFNSFMIEPGPKPMSVVVRGYTDRVKDWEKVRAMVSRDLTKISSIEDYVETPWTRKDSLEKMIAERGLDQETQVFLTRQGLVVKTSLAPSDEFKWDRVQKEYQRVFQNNPPVHRIKDKAPWLDIKSVNFGYEPYVETTDGKKYLIGSIVKNGYHLAEIGPEGIVLKKDDSVKNYPLP